MQNVKTALAEEESPSLIGHNWQSWLRISPVDGKAELDIDAETEHLREVFEPYRERLAEIRAGVARAPTDIDNEVDSKKVIDFIVTINGFCKLVDTDRKARRDVFARATGVIQTQLQEDIIDVLARDVATLNARLTAWQRRKAAEERRQREEEARRRNEEAEQARRAALEEERRLSEAAAPKEEDLARAITADDTAQIAEADAIAARQQATVKPAELSRERSSYGGTASLAEFWTLDENTIDRETVDLEALRPYLSLVDVAKAARGAIKAGIHAIRGINIYKTTKSRVR
jgi:flagellar biosynthesis GTPase FlhF